MVEKPASKLSISASFHSIDKKGIFESAFIIEMYMLFVKT